LETRALLSNPALTPDVTHKRRNASRVHPDANI
jgi:hypothetical protein